MNHNRIGGAASLTEALVSIPVFSWRGGLSPFHLGPLLVLRLVGEKLKEPNFFDWAQAASSAASGYYKEMGEIAKKLHTGALGPQDIQHAKNVLAWFSDVIMQEAGRER